MLPGMLQAEPVVSQGFVPPIMWTASLYEFCKDRQVEPTTVFYSVRQPLTAASCMALMKAISAHGFGAD